MEEKWSCCRIRREMGGWYSKMFKCEGFEEYFEDVNNIDTQEQVAVHIYVNSLACVRLKGGESECFRIDRGVRQGFIMSLWLFNVYRDALMKVKMGMGRRVKSGD